MGEIDMGAKSCKQYEVDHDDNKSITKEEFTSKTSKPMASEAPVEVYPSWVISVESLKAQGAALDLAVASTVCTKLLQLCQEHDSFIKGEDMSKSENMASQVALIEEIRALVVKSIDVDRHYASMIDAFTGAFGWFQLPEPSNQVKHIKEHIDASEFFLNRARSKTADFPDHKSFQRQYTDFMWKFHDFVKDRSTKPGTKLAMCIKTATQTPVEAKETTSKQKSKPDARKLSTTKSDQQLPRKELDGKKWLIEHQTENLVTVEGSSEQRVYMFNCADNTVKITGKVNTITVDKCKKTKFVFDSVISQVEVINSKSIQGQVLQLCPTLTVDGSSGLMFYVSPESTDANFQVIPSRSDAVNILLSNGESFEEVPIPDQFKTTFTNNEPITVPVDHA